jgi:hypothetical protein
MSVGGKVIETIPCDDVVWINTKEQHFGGECAIYVKNTPAALSISEGDSVWWQGKWAMWTPKNRAFADYKLERVGGSGISRQQALERNKI